MPGLDKLEIAWAEDRATQGCDLSADPSADRSGAVLTVAPDWPCWPKSDKSRGLGGRAPIWTKGYLPFEKTLTNGGESWSARVPLDPLFAKAISLIQASSRPTASAADQGPAPQFIMQMLDSGKSMRTTTGRLPNRESARCIPLLLPIHLSPELQAKLDRVAADNHCRQGEYVQQLVESYLDHDAWFRQKVTS